MADRIQFRRDTKARWTQYNPILLEGEVGYVLDDPNLYKIGDGVNAWNSLPFRGFDGTLVQETGKSDNSAMSQHAVTNAMLGVLTTFQADATDYDIWKERILGIYIKDTDTEDYYYSPPAGSKTANSITVTLYKSKQKLSADWVRVKDFTWSGDTSIDQVVRIETDNGVMYINPSKFASGSWSSQAYNNAGFDASTINNKNKQFLLVDGWWKSNFMYPDFQTLKQAIDNYTLNPGMTIEWETDEEKQGWFSYPAKADGTTNWNKSTLWRITKPIPVSPNRNYRVWLHATTIMGAVMQVDAEGNFIRHLVGGAASSSQSATIATGSYLFNTPNDCEYIIFGCGQSKLNEVYVECAQPWVKFLFDANPKSPDRTMVHVPDDQWLKGFYINKSGGVCTHVSYQITDFISLSSLSSLSSLVFQPNPTTGSINSGSSQNNVTWYDADKKFISGWAPASDLKTTVTLTVPEGAAYMRLSNIKNDPTGTGRVGYGGMIDFGVINAELLEILTGYLFDPEEDKNVDYYFSISTGYIDRYGIDHPISNPEWVWWSSPNFIPVTPGKTYLLSGTAQAASSGLNIISYYEKANESSYIDGIMNPLTGASVVYTNEPLTMPDNCHYIRLSGGKAVLSTFHFTGTEKDLQELLQREVQITKDEEDAPANTFAIPAFLDCVIGRDNDIFLDGITSEPDNNTVGALLLTGGGGDTPTGIVRRENTLRFTPTSASVNQRVTFARTDASLNTLFSSAMTFRPVRKDNGSGQERNVCISGDSLVASTTPTTEMYRMLAEDGDFVINQIGTRGSVSTSLHEGRGSWRWASYINPAYETTQFAGTTNAFMNGGKLDFKAYMTKNFASLSRKEIDYFIMALGTNDVTQGSSLVTQAKINQIIADAKTFIDAFFDETTGFPNAKFAVGLPGCGAPHFPYCNTRGDVFKRSIQLLNQAYINTFDNGKYHPNVTCVMHGAYIDRWNTYPYVDEPINDITPDVMIRKFTNAAHPTNNGYKQWGRGYYGKIRAFLNDLL